MRFPTQRAIIEAGVKMKDIWIATAGFVLGWLMSKTWQDPGCRVGLVVFLVVTAVMALAGQRRAVKWLERHGEASWPRT